MNSPHGLMPSSEPAPMISVVIPTYKRRDSVELALKSLSNQTLPASQYEVIVCIDGSEDGTREMACAFKAPYALRVHWQPNKGRAAARNAGIRMAAGQVIVMLDDDMQASPDLLRSHLEMHQLEQRIVVVGAAPIHVDASDSPTTKFVGEKFNKHLQQLSERAHDFSLRDFYSGNFSIRRSVLLETGLFDETFTEYGNEDVELSLRLQRAGVKLVYSAAALAYQSYNKNFHGLANDNIAKGRTTVQMVRKHPEIFHSSKLAGYAQAPRTWKLVRQLLLTTTRHWPGTSDLLIASIAMLEKWRVPNLHRLYGFATDYFYWLGVEATLAEDRLDLNAFRSQVTA